MNRAFYTAVICERGHVLNAAWELSPADMPTFCKYCGSKTLRACPACSEPLHGRRVGDRVLSLRPRIADPVCSPCGAAYPWTVAALSDLQQEVDRVTTLTAAEKGELMGAAEVVVRGAATASNAADRFRSLAAQAGPALLATAKSLLETVVVPALARRIWGP